MDLSLLVPFIPHGAVGLALVGGVYWMQRHEKQDDKRFKFVAEKLDTLGTKMDALSEKLGDERAKVRELLLEWKRDDYR